MLGDLIPVPRQRIRGEPTAIELARRRRGLLVRELADEVGISRQYLSYIERGRYYPSKRVRSRMATALGVSESFLFEDSV
jgi:transcriptional regulator with XRE-family HTH domain